MTQAVCHRPVTHMRACSVLLCVREIRVRYKWNTREIWSTVYMIHIQMTQAVCHGPLTYMRACSGLVCSWDTSAIPVRYECDVIYSVYNTQMNDAGYMSQACHTYEGMQCLGVCSWDTSEIQVRYEWDTSEIRVRYDPHCVRYTYEWRRPYIRGLSHIWPVTCSLSHTWMQQAICQTPVTNIL